MSELSEKSIQILELPQVLTMLSGCAVTEEGKEKSLTLRPMTDIDDIQRAQGETSAAVKMLILRGSPGFSGVKPVAASLQRADMGGSLSTRELTDVAAVLRAARTAGDYGASQEKSPISHLFQALTPNRFLEERITNSILGEDEIADSASPELASIRRHMRAAEAKVRDILQRLISSNQSKYLQESIITIRSDRYVVPVKSEHKNAIPGLVHDVSSSGSTFFIEPMGVVKANNELRELAAKEKKEIERILAELSADCAAHKEDILEDYQLIVWLDTIFARAQLSLKLECSEPKLSDKFLRLRRARHPLIDKKKAVPNDLELGERFDTLVITGPNTGGKTVTLKTIGLITLMAQCGLHIPAGSDSTVRVFRRVLADIGDEQSIAQSLSTFSSHMVNIVGILKEADDESLILFDELGAGTDPVEGAALAAAVIESVRGMGAQVCATTHYAELKVYAMTTPGVENASCEFNVDTLAPTYRLVLGIPGKSNAFAISRRLGLPEYIIDKAAARLDAENVRFEDVLTRLDQQRQEMEKERAEARRMLNEAERNLGGSAPQTEAPPPTRPAVAGDTVELVSMGTKATVLSVNKDGSLQLQAGILKISAKQEEVRVVEGETHTQREARKTVARAPHTLRTAAVPSQIDLRGMMTDEAISVLERFLDTAMMGKLETVTIIHGKGTGAVRKAVRTYLKRSRYIKAFRPGRYGEGEDGVTVAELR